MAWQTLCSRETIADGQARGFDPQGLGRTTVFVIHWQRQWRAWRDWCPHWHTGPMAWRRNAYFSGDGQTVMCHAHGACFHPLSGECTRGPCLGQGLLPVTMRVDDTGGIQIDLDNSPSLPAAGPTRATEPPSP